MIEIHDAKSAEVLRTLLQSELKKRETVWLDLRGISVHRVAEHSAFMRALADLGFDPEPPQALPRRVVLDWSGVDTVSAEGIAFFSVLVRYLLEIEVKVLVCSASCADIAEVLWETGLRSALSEVNWVPQPSVPSNRIRAIGHAAVLRGAEGRARASKFVNGLGNSLREFEFEGNAVGLAEAVAMELLQNVLEHSGDVWATAVSLVQHRRRPPWIQIGVADLGAGVAEHVLAQVRHQDLGQFSDLAVIQAVFSAALSGRASGSGGGGLSMLVKDIVERHGGEAWVRSGSGLVGFSTGGKRWVRPTHLTAGFGTQIRISFPVDPHA